MGGVYQGKHLLLERPVAIKVMRPADAGDADAEQQFLAEGRHLALVQHPNVVEIFDLGRTRGLYYIVMAYLEGETLSVRLQREGRLAIADACTLGHQLLAGLAAAHELGILHRDVKPENVFLRKTPDGCIHAKLLDFGISTSLAAGSTGAMGVAGTPAYMAPEQAVGSRLDERTDVYGVGATLYEAVTGEPPFDAKNALLILGRVIRDRPVPPHRYRPDLPESVEAVVMRALAKSPAERFQSAGEMLVACGAAAAGLATLSAEQRYVLVAEADPIAAACCRDIAEDLGRACVIARDGMEALVLLQGMGPPSLLVANLSLPRLDGFALLKEIRKTIPAAVLPAIVASGSPTMRDAAWIRREALGVSQVLVGLREPDRVREAFSMALSRGAAGPDSRPSSVPARPTFDGRRVERMRLEKIASMGLVDDLAAPAALQRLVTDLAGALDVPIALVSLVLEDRQWFKAHFGLAGPLLADRGTPLDWAFCSHVVAEGMPLVVPDAREHPVFGDNPLVTSGAVCGYAGVPVVASTGEVLGTLCVIDSEPLHLGAEVLDALFVLARRVGGELDLLSAKARPSPSRSSEPSPAPDGTHTAPSPRPSQAERQPAPLSALPSIEDEDDGSKLRLDALLRDPGIGVLLTDADQRIVHASEGMCSMWGVALPQIAGRPRGELLERIFAQAADRAVAQRELENTPRGPFLAFSTVPLRSGVDSRERRLRWHAKPLVVPQGTWTLETYRIDSE